jgi:hypothetical protein
MKRFVICLALLAPVLPALGKESFPRDVQRFVDRREGCDHMRGEIPEPSEKQRMKEVSREIRKLCTGTDKELAQLKRKYASYSAIMQVLNQFEPDIEATEASVSKAKAGHKAR